MRTLTPLKAIRAKCLDCSCDSKKEVRECPITDCPLYAYRMGKRPQKGKPSTDDTKAKKGEAAPQFFAS